MHADDRDRELKKDDEVPVSDRRRFSPDGSLREPGGEAGQPAGGEGDASAGGIELAPAAESVADETRFNGDDSLPGGPADSDGPPPPLYPSPADDWERRALAAESRLRELSEALQRGRADLDAARARVERDREQRVREAVGRAFEKFLVALDNVERALSHAPEGPLAEGMRHIQRQILEAMAAEGLERLEVVGRQFDPTVAEAVATSASDDLAGTPTGTVVEEYQAGYRIGDRVLRPARVRVAL